MGRSEQMLSGIASLQREGVLCDITLQAEGQELSAHRVVLAAASPYFRAMFSGGFQESKQDTITLQKVSFAGLKAVIDCIYSTKLHLCDENISDITETAHMLQMEDDNLQIVNECRDWMNENMNKDNCLILFTLADKLNFIEVQGAVHGYIMKNFVSVKETEQFKHISQQVLGKLLESDTLRTGLNEMLVFRAAQLWIIHNDVVDKDVISEIMKNVRFGLMTRDEISKLFSEETVTGNPKCRKMVKEASNYLANVNAQPLHDSNLNKPRGKPGVILIRQGKPIRRDGNVGNETSLHFLNYPTFKESKKRSLETVVLADTIRAVQVNSFVFLFGTYVQGRQNFTKRYDVSNDSWLELTGMPCDPVFLCSAAYCKGAIFSIGGIFSKHRSRVRATPKGNATDQVYAYNISTNDWKACSKFPIKSTESATCSHGGLIYVTGGILPNEDVSSQLFAYDVNANLWSTKSSMRHEYEIPMMAAIDNRIYVIGVASETESGITCAERYNIIADQWTEINIPDYLQSIWSGFVADNKIYIIGFTNGAEWGRDRYSIHIFDPEKDTLEDTDEIITIRSLMSFYVTLPKGRRAKFNV